MLVGRTRLDDLRMLYGARKLYDDTKLYHNDVDNVPMMHGATNT